MKLCLCFADLPIYLGKYFINILFGIVVDATVGAISEDLQSLEDGIRPKAGQPFEPFPVCFFRIVFIHVFYIAHTQYTYKGDAYLCNGDNSRCQEKMQGKDDNPTDQAF
jgi:hypothetical protein